MIAGLSSAREKARDTARLSDIKAIQTAILMAVANGETVPHNIFVDLTSSYTGALHTLLVDGGYLPSIPYEKTPLSSSYYYKFCTTASSPQACFVDTNPETWAIRFFLVGKQQWMCANSQSIEPAVNDSGIMRCYQR